MKVVCLSTNTGFGKEYKSQVDLNGIITPGKIYDVIIDSSELSPDLIKIYSIKCDDGWVRALLSDLFQSLDEWRSERINNILK